MLEPRLHCNKSSLALFERKIFIWVLYIGPGYFDICLSTVSKLHNSNLPQYYHILIFTMIDVIFLLMTVNLKKSLDQYIFCSDIY